MGASERSARSRQCGTSERVERIKLESSIAPSLASSYPYRRSGAARRTSDSNWRNCTACIQRLRIILDNAARELREWELQLALTGQMVQSHTFLTTQTPCTGISIILGLSCVIEPFRSLGPAATLRQHCLQMTQRRCTLISVAVCEIGH